MKKWIVVLSGVLLCLCMAGCSQLPAPEQAADGSPWREDWVTIGNVVGVDTPAGVEFRENNEALGDRGMYYAAWSMGAETPFVNADGDDAVIYDAQFSLLLAGYDSAEKAEDTLADWQGMAASGYRVEETREGAYNGQSFTVMTYTYVSETNPYQRGAAAFGVYGNYAVSVELSCMEDFDGDAQALLADFLEHCHYAA